MHVHQPSTNGRAAGNTSNAGQLSAALSQFPSHGVAPAGVERTEARLAGRSGVASTQARTSGRVALIIGNSKYAAIDKLANPERDAKLVVTAMMPTAR